MKHPLAIALVVLALNACGGGAGTHDSGSGEQEKPVTSIAEALQRLEKRGDVPLLNRDDTLSGPDADGNGIRDDIDAYIKGLPDTPEQKRALAQEAAVLQSAVLFQGTDQSTVLEIGRRQAAAINCLFDQHKGAEALATQRFNALEKYTANTKARFKAYMHYNNAASGTSTVMPQGNTCE